MLSLPTLKTGCPSMQRVRREMLRPLRTLTVSVNEASPYPSYQTLAMTFPCA